MAQFKHGDESAFRELFTRFKDPIYGFVRRRVPDPNRAEDITQEVFLAVVKNRNGYKRRATFRTYIYRIAHNRIVSEYRSRKNRKDDAVLDGDTAPAKGGNPESTNQVRQALDQIDADQRAVVMLREYDGLSYEEIGQVLRVPVGTVRSRLYRGKMALRKLLSPAGQDGTQQGAQQ